jgi:hypothetical protein
MKYGGVGMDVQVLFLPEGMIFSVCRFTLDMVMNHIVGLRCSR